jgi:hypothetical protein
VVTKTKELIEILEAMNEGNPIAKDIIDIMKEDKNA